MTQITQMRAWQSTFFGKGSWQLPVISFQPELASENRRLKAEANLLGARRNRPLTRPAPAGESAGSGTPSPQGRGQGPDSRAMEGSYGDRIYQFSALSLQ